MLYSFISESLPYSYNVLTNTQWLSAVNYVNLFASYCSFQEPTPGDDDVVQKQNSENRTDSVNSVNVTTPPRPSDGQEIEFEVCSRRFTHDGVNPCVLMGTLIVRFTV